MTQTPGYWPTEAPVVPVRREGWRWFVVGLACVVGTPAAAVAAVVGAIVWSGCFLSCSEGNPLAGGLLVLLGVALLLSAPVLAGWLLRRWTAVGVALLGQLLVAVLSVLAVRF